MSGVDWSGVLQPPPTPKQLARYRRWMVYFRDSRLTVSERRTRAARFAEAGREPPK
jgi:hypothetical protein